MTSESREMARWRMENARRTLHAARVLMDADSFRDAINRAYYATFYAARALLATREQDSSKHSGVIAPFNREFVKSGVVDRTDGKRLEALFRSRQEGDYTDLVEITADQAAEALQDAENFVSRTAEVLQTLLEA